MSTKFEPRPPQRKWIDILRQREHGGVEWCVGSGKTAAIALATVEHRVPTLIIVPSISLLEQTKDKITEFTTIPENQIGLCYGGSFDLKPVTCATMDTVAGRLEEFKAYGFKQLQVDEAHFAGARSLFEAVSELDCYYRYFYSGTFYREDHDYRKPGQLDMHGENMLLKAVALEILDYRSYQDGVKDGYLAPVSVTCIDPGPALEGCGYAKARSRGIVNCGHRNTAYVREIQMELKDGKTVLALVIEKEHADILSGIFDAYDIPHGVITGDTTLAKRESIISDLRDRKLQLVIGTSCVRTGLDVATLDVVANIGGLKSYRATIQGTGRGTRVGSVQTEDMPEYIKSVGKIIDCMDRHHHTLAEHALTRMKAYHKEGFSVPHLTEYFEEEARLKRLRQKRATNIVEKARARRIARLPNLKQQLFEIEALLSDPDRKTQFTTPQLIKQRARLENEIKAIEQQAKKQLGEAESDNE